jgi:hypothetical protein
VTTQLTTQATLEHHILDYEELQPLVNYYAQVNDPARAKCYQQLLDMANGRYDFSQATLNELVGRSRDLDVQPMSFGQWFSRVWQSAS